MKNPEKINAKIKQERKEQTDHTEDEISERLKDPDEKRKLEKEIKKDMLANSGLGDGPTIGGAGED